MIRDARRLKELTDNNLDTARFESQSMSLNNEVVDIDNLILDAVQHGVKNQTMVNRDLKLVYYP
jgi:K+-sensing histidine kinase KdpD